MPAKSPTLRDVAQQVGVSLFTVSAVLNGSSSNTRVSAATRQRILAAANELGYHPNAIARSLARQRTSTLGVLFGVARSEDVITNPYTSAILQGIISASAQAGYGIYLFPEVWINAQTSGSLFRDRRTDGILVVAPPYDSDMMAALAAGGMAVAAVSLGPDGAAIPSADVDNALGMELAVDHLLHMGHRRIAFITGNANMPSTRMRLEAFGRRMSREGVPVPTEYVIAGAYDASTAGDATRRLLALPEPPTAVLAGNDAIAMETLRAARDLEVPVPDRLSVVGYDDTPAAALVTPALTTVRQPLSAIGATAARLLIARIQGEPCATEPCLLAPELIVRQSTGPAPLITLQKAERS